MHKVNTVWAIIFIEAEDGSADIDDWNVGSALFSNEADAIDYAHVLAEFDSMNVYDVIHLQVYEGKASQVDTSNSSVLE